MRTKQTLIAIALALISLQATAQFKDSSWLMLHDVSINYQRRSTIDTFDRSGPVGLLPSIGINYMVSAGKLKKNNLFFYGVQFLFDESKNLGKDSRMGTGTTVIQGGVHAGMKKFIPVFSKVYINPTGIVAINLGKERYWGSEGITSAPGTFYNLSLFSGVFHFQPLRLGYKISKTGLLEFNFFETQIGYRRQKGARIGVNSNIEKSNVFIQSSFLQALDITFIHTLNSKK